MPASPAESHGMEDARFVRFADDDGTPTTSPRTRRTTGAHHARSCCARRLPHFRSASSSRSRVAQQGPGAVPSPGRRTLPALSRCRPREQRDRGLRRCALGRAASWCRRRASRGRRCSWATAGRRSRPRPAGWCSPTGSARCGSTASVPCCSTWTTRPSCWGGRRRRCSRRLLTSDGLRAQRRLLVRCARARPHARPALRLQRHRHPLCDGRPADPSGPLAHVALPRTNDLAMSCTGREADRCPRPPSGNGLLGWRARWTALATGSRSELLRPLSAVISSPEQAARTPGVTPASSATRSQWAVP